MGTLDERPGTPDQKPDGSRDPSTPLGQILRRAARVLLSKLCVGGCANQSDMRDAIIATPSTFVAVRRKVKSGNWSVNLVVRLDGPTLPKSVGPLHRAKRSMKFPSR